MKSPITANHEMNRELLWRNYPTDMRGTSLRNFWSIRGGKTSYKFEWFHY
jgi:hypothetical protein